jgi:hypothetical protein
MAAVQDERVRLILELLGKGQFSEATVEVNKLKVELQNLDTVSRQNLSQGMRTAGMSVLYLSQAIEDAQYGVRSILNNIPMLVMSLGGGPGLAGVASLAAVAISQLVEHWDDLTKLWSQNQTQTEAQNMEKLGKAIATTREEMDKMVEAEKQLREQRAKLVEAPGAEQAARAKGVAEAFGKVGGEGAIRDLARALEEEIKARFGARFPAGDQTQVAQTLINQAMGREGIGAQQDAERTLQRLLGTTRGFGRSAFGAEIAGMGAAAAQQRMMGGVGRDFATQMAMGMFMGGGAMAVSPEQARKDLREAERQKEEAEREKEKADREREAEARRGAQDFLQNNPGIMEILKGNLAMRGADQHAVYAVNAMLKSQTGLPNEVSYAVVNQALLELMRELTMRQNRIDAQFNSAAQYMRMLRESLENPAAMQNNGRF